MSDGSPGNRLTIRLTKTTVCAVTDVSHVSEAPAPCRVTGCGSVSRIDRTRHGLAIEPLPLVVAKLVRCRTLGHCSRGPEVLLELFRLM